MRTAAIIAEYNPFHTGHAYQIAELKRQLDVTHVIVIMSGDFVQRGAPAIMDKYERTRLALEGGADVIIELPVWAASASALDFASGAISILNGLGCIDYLCFGSEEGSLAALTQASNLFLDEPPAYKSALKQALSSGKSFPKARKAAWEAVTGEKGDFLDEPNNILGISYLMALKQQSSSIQPYTIKRKGSFHSSSLDVEFASASALRNRLLQTAASAEFPEDIQAYFPNTPSFAELKSQFGQGYPLCREDFWPILKTALLSENTNASSYADFPEELANRLQKQYFTSVSYEALAQSLKTAVFTRSRIDRALFHLLLQIPETLIQDLKRNPKERYARILGFRKESSGILRPMTGKSTIPVLTKAVPSDELTPLMKNAYELDIYASNLYETVKSFHTASYTPMHEFRRKLLLV